jgi:protein-S-isoprenylcysteine O-methyltransferase Ste14
MSHNAGNETFVGYAGLLFLAAILCFPMMGWSGVFSVLCMIYFCLVLTNGAGNAAKRRHRRR